MVDSGMPANYLINRKHKKCSNLPRHSETDQIGIFCDNTKGSKKITLDKILQNMLHRTDIPIHSRPWWHCDLLVWMWQHVKPYHIVLICTITIWLYLCHRQRSGWLCHSPLLQVLWFGIAAHICRACIKNVGIDSQPTSIVYFRYFGPLKQVTDNPLQQ